MDQSELVVLDHDGVEILERNSAVVVAISFLQHHFQSLLIETLLDVPVDFPEVVQVDVVLVGSVVFLENGSNLFFVLVQVGLGAHGLHELVEADTTGLLQVKLGDDFVHCLLVGVESVLLEQKSQIIGQKHTHTRRIISIEDFFQIDNILDEEFAGYVVLRLKMFKVFSSESDSVQLVAAFSPALAFFRAVAEFLVPVLLGGPGIGEGSRLGLFPIVHEYDVNLTNLLVIIKFKTLSYNCQSLKSLISMLLFPLLSFL